MFNTSKVHYTHSPIARLDDKLITYKHGKGK
jgi:hypothetical protein